MPSTMPISAEAAGTKQPTCAMMTITATCRMYVDLPAMLGPVIIETRFWFGSISRSFGTNGVEPPSSASTTGCRLSFR